MKFGYRDITDVALIDLETDEHVIFMDYLQTASNTYGQETTYLMGGRGAPKLVGFKSDNAMRMEMTSAILSPELLAIMFGTEAETNSQNVPVTEVLTVTGSTIALSATPVISTGFDVVLSETLDKSIPTVNLERVAATPTATQFTVSGNVISLNGTEYSSGGIFIITYYKASTASNKRVSMKTDKFTKAYKLTGYTLWKNEANQKHYPCRIEIPKIQLEIDGVSLNSAMNGDATTLTFEGECLKSETNDLVIYDIDEGEIVE
jgi:hypothetical protein